MSDHDDPNGAGSGVPPYQPPAYPGGRPPAGGQPYPGAPQQPSGYPAPPGEQPSFGYPPPGGYQPGQPAAGGYQPGYQQPGYQPAPGPGYQPDGQPGYPPPGGGWGAPEGGWNPPPAPSHTRRNIIIAAVAAVVVAGGVIAAVAATGGGGNSSGGGSTHPHLPASFAGYTQLHNATATQVEKSMRSLGQNMSGGAAQRIFDAATIGVYAHNSGDQPVLITLAVPTSAAGSNTNPGDVTNEILSGATTDNASYPPGPNGGSTRCGMAQFGAVSETMCAWSDSKQSGVLVSVRESLSPSDLADLTRKFRAEVE